MPSSARWVGPLVACAMAACSGNSGPPMRIRLAHAATGDARCFVPGGGPQPDDQQLAGVTLTDPLGADLKIEKVRITVRTHAPGDVAGTFLCDRMLNVPKDVPSLKIPRGGAESVDIYAEAWAPLQPGDAIPRRVAVGSLLGVPLSAKTIADLRLYPDERFRCANQAMHRPRAFHSATLLPNGQVLLVGGLTPTPDAGDETFSMAPVYITAEAEIYDPSTGGFAQVVEDDSPEPRAFHQAAFVGKTDDGKYQVLLVGGATADATQAAFGVNTSAAPGTRIVPFDTSGALPNPLPAKAADAELLVYNPVDHSATRTLMAGFTPGVFQAGATFPDGIAVAGGIDWMTMPLAASIPQIKRAEVSRNLAAPRAVAQLYGRMGATMTALTDDAALVWGGQIAPTDPAGDYVTGLSATGTLKDVAVTLATAPPTQFHTATLLPQSMSTTNRSIIVTGGFVETTTNMGQALQPPAPSMAARLLTVSTAGTVSQSSPMFSTQYSLDSTCSKDDRYRPAGWESATDLGRGRVLIAGGAPTFAGGCNNCDDGGSDYRCSTQQASLFTAPSTISPTLEKLQIPRYGHTATLMADGNVLVVGGVTSAAGNPRILRDVEVYNPRPIVPAFDATLGDPDDPVAADLSGTPRTPGAPLNAATQCGVL